MAGRVSLERGGGEYSWKGGDYSNRSVDIAIEA
jgi:hypothetical protein